MTVSHVNQSHYFVENKSTFRLFSRQTFSIWRPARATPRAATINHRHFTVAINSQIMKCAIAIMPCKPLFNLNKNTVYFSFLPQSRSPGTKCFTQQIILNLETIVKKTYFQLISTGNCETNKESAERGQHSLIM